MKYKPTALSEQHQTNVAEVFDIVEQITGVSKKMMLANTRKRFVVDARKILVCILRHHVKLTCIQIGGIINKDHSSIVHYDRMHNVHMMEKEYRRLYSAATGTFLIYKSVKDEERLREQFTSLTDRTKALLTALEGQQNKLNITLNTITNAPIDEKAK
tara:strand:- start:15089 stop:15562 length:474 start_codon:yes stop_codon:yes gene_type:complete